MSRLIGRPLPSVPTIGPAHGPVSATKRLAARRGQAAEPPPVLPTQVRRVEPPNSSNAQIDLS